MQELKIRIKERICERLGVRIDQLYATINANTDVHINGSISLCDESKYDDYAMHIKANICDEDGRILDILKTYNEISLSSTGYNAFGLFCTNTSRYFDKKDAAYVEIYPIVE